MTLTLKPQYRWSDGHFQELAQTFDNVLSIPTKDTYIAVWNNFDQKYEWGLSNGRYIERIWDFNHLPVEFRAGLLLVGVP